MFCAYCTKVLRESPLKAADDRIHHGSARSFKDSVDQGCYICGSLWRLWTRDGQLDLTSSDDPEGGFTVCSVTLASPEATPSFEPATIWATRGEQAGRDDASDFCIPATSSFSGNRTPGEIWELWLSLGRNVKPESPEVGCFVLQDASNGGKGTVAHCSKVSRSFIPSLMDCQRLAYAWFEDCLHNHTSCGTIQQGHESSWYPTRLLDIGTTQEPAIRICITAEERPQGSYMTLSHCWGSAPVVQLKGENAKAMREHVRFEELPQLFQDAVMLARFFKVRYLWIDSLCIEQDSADDFQREATSMSEVYGNAICNIAATSSPDSDTGLFAERLCSESLPYDVFSVKREGQEQWLSVVDTRLWLSNTFETPLNRRAWVLQERLLSPRIIHCGRNQLLWECSEKEACETFPHGLPAYLTSPYFDFKSLEILHGPSEARSRPALQETTTIEDPITNSKDAAHTLTEAPPNHPPRPPTLKAYRLSTAILKSYTRCSLTRPQDKLIALSGLAQRLRLRLQDTYLAGLWLRVLPSQLCWKVLACRQSNGRPSYRPPTYRAPSWSWAAVDGEIDFPTPYFSGGGTSLIRVVDVAVTARSGNAFGQVTGGFVKLQGRLLRGRVACHSDAKRAAELVEVEGKDIGDEQCSVDLDVQPLEQKLDVYLLPIESGSQATWLRGVVLQPATQSPQGTYTRLGVFFAVPRVRGPFYGGIEPGQAGRALLEEEDADAITLV